MMIKKQKMLGFTLLELMIVVAIVAILAAIAYPSYQDSVRKARRGDAQAGLVELANFLERRFTESNEYDGSNAATTLTASGVISNYYTLSITNFNTTTYTLQAVPQGDQVADSCATMRLLHTGEKQTTGTAGCW